jgi:hypothetical protein
MRVSIVFYDHLIAGLSVAVHVLYVSCLVNVICGTDIDRAPVVPVIRPGVETEEERARARQQLAMYRRLFMDIEREQIRENIRQRDHRMKMAV